MRAIYPFVGGNENAHKYNLKDPRDLDAAYRLQFYGGMTHDSRGIIPNGSSYADTKLNTNILSMTNTSFSIYLGSTDRTGLPYPVDLGVFTADYSGRYGLSLASSDGNSYFDVYNRSTIPNSNLGSGFVQYSRTSTSLAKVYYKNTYTHTNTSSTSQYSNPNSTIYLSALHIGSTVDSTSIRIQSFSTIGDGLTDTEAANLYTVVQAFQTTLGRAI
jgi:hypothetical protein